QLHLMTISLLIIKRHVVPKFFRHETRSFWLGGTGTISLVGVDDVCDGRNKKQRRAVVSQ
ncbi:MAG: hypothetical protein ACRC9G_13345, partial [Aeromonas veronii]